MSSLSTEISPRAGGRYKSISNLFWSDVPGLAILTGRNGSGKTQLLEVLAYHLSGAIPNEFRQTGILPVEVAFDGAEYKSEQIAYVPSSGRFSGGTPVSLATLPQARQQALNYVQQAHAYTSDITNTIKSKRVAAMLNGRNPHNLAPDELNQVFRDDFEFMLDDVDVTTGLTYVFIAYRMKHLESLDRGTPGFNADGQPLGPAPWEVVNQSLAVARFPYEVISPAKTSIVDTYELKLRDTRSGTEIRALDLSSGEQVILQMTLWLYSSGKEGIFPKLLLIDEPDAHLHPSMATQFLDVISEVLVGKHGVRVIMTTHSPSTVALAPEGSMFYLERGAETVEKIIDRAGIISDLTAGLVTVSRTTKFCFVEDEDDVEFYDAIREVLTDYGPSRDPLALKPSPSIVFIPASVGSGAGKTSGGSKNVEKWVNKMDAEPLNQTFLGLIDRDISNVANGRMHVIGRYSFENYMLDPLNIFCLLVEEGINPPVAGLSISTGDEHLLRVQPPHILQTVSNTITESMENIEPNLKTIDCSSVAYTIGFSIKVPSWVVEQQGHSLLPIAQAAFGGPRILTPKRLIKALRRGRLIPSELAVVLRAIQGA